MGGQHRPGSCQPAAFGPHIPFDILGLSVGEGDVIRDPVPDGLASCQELDNQLCQRD
jgi:hypothetical protein